MEVQSIESGAGAMPVLMTRKQAVPFLNSHGYPITESTIEKLSAPAVGKGPRVAAWFGIRALHTPEDLLAWAQSLLSNEPSRLGHTTQKTPPAGFVG